MTTRPRPPVVLSSTASPTEATLNLKDRDGIPVGSSHWFTWLEKNSSFRFESGNAGENSFTAKKHPRPTGNFWYAYRKLDNKLCSAYLGRSEGLTVERLVEAADKIINPPAKPEKLVKSRAQPQYPTHELSTGLDTVLPISPDELDERIRAVLRAELVIIEERLGKR